LVILIFSSFSNNVLFSFTARGHQAQGHSVAKAPEYAVEITPVDPKEAFEEIFEGNRHSKPYHPGKEMETKPYNPDDNAILIDPAFPIEEKPINDFESINIAPDTPVYHNNPQRPDIIIVVINDNGMFPQNDDEIHPCKVKQLFNEFLNWYSSLLLFIFHSKIKSNII